MSAVNEVVLYQELAAQNGKKIVRLVKWMHNFKCHEHIHLKVPNVEIDFGVCVQLLRTLRQRLG